MIGFRVNGRLGNQLFQLAAAYALTKHHRMPLSILPDERGGEFIIDKYFDTNIKWPLGWKIARSIPSIFPKQFRSRVRKYCFRYYYGLKQIPLYQPNEAMCIDKNFFNLNNNIIIDGYFQSEYYFKSYRDEIFALFKIKSQYNYEWKKWYNTLPLHQELISVHIRLGDYKTQPGWELGASDMTLPSDYYIGLINQLKAPGKLFIILSDEPTIAEEWFKSQDNIIVSRENLISDLLTLMHSESCILSHSSFSWWGAWLNVRKNPTIYVPENFQGFRIGRMVPEQVIPDKWIQIPVKL